MLSSFVEISTELAQALESGSVLVTANERLSREYRRAYDLKNAALGKRAWVTPNIKSLRRYFIDEYAALREAQPAKYATVLSRTRMLSTAFELEPDLPTHLIQNFVNAFEVCRGYEISPEDIGAYHNGGMFFSTWADRLATATGEYLFQQDIPHVLIEAGRVPSAPIITVLLEELNHLEQTYFDWVCSKTDICRLDPECRLSPAESARDLRDEPSTDGIEVSRIYSAPNFADELNAAAAWATKALEDNPEQRVGIVVPTLSSDHAKVCEVVGLALNSDLGSEDPRFDVSGGESLAQQAVWQAAEKFLDFVFAQRSTTSVQALGANPYFSKLGLDALEIWPRNLRAQPSLKDIARFVRTDWLQLVVSEDLESERDLAGWAKLFRSYLEHTGWPNLSQLGSRQYQAYRAIDQALDNVGSSGPMGARTALAHLSLSLSSETFASETTPSNLLVLGLLEANGLTFDSLWVCGLDNENFPGKNAATPLIPRRIAKRAGVPRADQDDELVFAQRLLRRWASQSKELITSFTRVAEDAERQVSQLLTNAETIQLPASDAPRWWRHKEVQLESFSDDVGLALPESETTRGGVRLLEDQAACPFRAYAVHRLALPRVESPSSLPNPLVRGILLHDALQALFTAATNKSEIEKIGHGEIDTAIRQAIQRLSIALPSEFEVHEKKRLTELIHGWLDVEALREEFDVFALESSYTLTLDRMQLTVRADRIDRLKNGSLIVIDYKTGQVTTSGITDTPITRPQLPVYSIVEEGIKGAFYASIRNDDTRFIGVCDEAGVPGEAKLHPLERSWSEQIKLWQNELDHLAHDYVIGYAKVEPMRGACDYCHLHAFCRISETTQ